MISPVKIWRHQKKVVSLLGQEGKIISWTKIFVPPLGFEEMAPYRIVLVEFKDKARMVGQFVNAKEKNLCFGQKVKAVYRRVRRPDAEGIIPYGIKFELV